MKNMCIFKTFSRVLVFVLLLFCGAIFVGCGDNSKPENQVSDIIISEDFFNTPIYQNSNIDLSQFHVYIINTINNTETFTLDEFITNPIDTSSLGVHTLMISYNNKTKAFDYTVLPVNMVAARYNGEPITYYKHESANLDDVKFLVLYSDGKDKYFDLSLATITFEDLTVSDQVKTATATYAGITFSVEYVVRNREIKFDTTYDYIDKTNQANATSTERKIIFTKSESKLTFTIFTVSDGISTKQMSKNIKESDIPNEYVFTAVKNGKIKTFVFYLTANGIVRDIKQ